MKQFDLIAQYFGVIALILTACHLMGYVSRFLKQPPVVGEMIIGVLLGPSLLGWVFPEWHASLFTSSVKETLFILSQIGLVLYMFLVGAEMDLMSLNVKKASRISMAGIIFPFGLGAVAAHFTYNNSDYFSANVTELQAILFIGAALSITAFPMLARIIYERNLTHTTMGRFSLAAGAVDDIIAWCLFAIVVASLTNKNSVAYLAVGGVFIFIGGLILARKWILAPMLKKYAEQGANDYRGLRVLLIMLFVATLITDRMGLHVVFGAFALGAVLPKGKFTQSLQKNLSGLTSVLMLPLFFTYSGLNTKLSLVSNFDSLIFAFIVILIASLGKGVACWAAARSSGLSQHESISIGALMNARGLMELILLNMALQQGIITERLFSIFVLMAVVTTLLATPIFDWSQKRLVVARRSPGKDLELLEDDSESPLFEPTV